MLFFLPSIDSEYVLEEDWSFEIGWNDNLTFLKQYGITKTVTVTAKKWDYIEFPLRTDPPSTVHRSIQVDYQKRETVRNKMFMDDNGEMTDVMITLQKGTILKLHKMKGYKHDLPYLYGFKVIYSPEKKLIKTSFSIDAKQLMTLSVET